ncbi:hypothetical protein AAG747_28565 [Rapidithrix thailandica]|uniref:Uncharacterized protein n=1 Tax=Rapidithrix thailandica TaxID=413964 RepID=A0AAW9SDK9_9BACT
MDKSKNTLITVIIFTFISITGFSQPNKKSVWFKDIDSDRFKVLWKSNGIIHESVTTFEITSKEKLTLEVSNLKEFIFSESTGNPGNRFIILFKAEKALERVIENVIKLNDALGVIVYYCINENKLVIEEYRMNRKKQYNLNIDCPTFTYICLDAQSSFFEEDGFHLRTYEGEEVILYYKK